MSAKIRKGLMAYLTVAAVLLAVPAFGADWYIDQQAPPGGDGTSARPVRTLSAAKALLKTGDTVWIRNGVYNEVVDFWHIPAGSGGRTTIRAAPGHNPIIDGGGGRFALQAGETSNMTFRGLTVRHTGSAFHFYHADDGEVIECKTESVGAAVTFYYSNRGTVRDSDLWGSVSGRHSDGTVVAGNRIHDSSAEGIAIYGNSSNLKYLNNEVYNNTSVNIYVDSASHVLVDGNLVYMTKDPPTDQAGIQLADEKYSDVTAPVLNDVTITNNVIVGNWSGIVFWEGSFPGESGMRNVTIANNTVLDSKGLGIRWDKGKHENAVVINNIFANKNRPGILLLLANTTSGVEIHHNLWFMPNVAKPFNWDGDTTYDHSRWVAISGQGAGDISEDPRFAGPWSLPVTNFQLTAPSPARDRGVALPQFTSDFFGKPRPFGARWDLGAFEFDGAKPSAGVTVGGGGTALLH